MVLQEKLATTKIHVRGTSKTVSARTFTQLQLLLILQTSQLQLARRDLAQKTCVLMCWSAMPCYIWIIFLPQEPIYISIVMSIVLLFLIERIAARRTQQRYGWSKLWRVHVTYKAWQKELAYRTSDEVQVLY